MKNKTAFPFWGFLPALVPIVLLVNLLCHNSEVFSRWLGFAYWALASLVVLCAVWMAYRTYLKWLEMQQEQELKIKKEEKETRLAELHTTRRKEIEEKEYELRKEKAEREDRLKIETLRSENLLKLADKLFDRQEEIKKEDGKETKTVTVNLRKELLDELKIIKKEWDKMMNDSENMTAPEGPVSVDK